MVGFFVLSSVVVRSPALSMNVHPWPLPSILGLFMDFFDEVAFSQGVQYRDANWWYRHLKKMTDGICTPVIISKKQNILMDILQPCNGSVQMVWAEIIDAWVGVAPDAVVILFGNRQREPRRRERKETAREHLISKEVTWKPLTSNNKIIHGLNGWDMLNDSR